MRATRILLICLCCIACASCHDGLNLDAVRGRWQSGHDEIEFLPSGQVRFKTSGGVLEGTYSMASRIEIRVDLGLRWPSGEPRYWRAMVQGDQLGLCETHNGRHCLRFARVWRRVRVLPR